LNKLVVKIPQISALNFFQNTPCTEKSPCYIPRSVSASDGDNGSFIGSADN